MQPKNKILVIDDDEIISSWIKIVLEETGYSVVTLNNPLLFFDLIDDEKIDLILLDIIMPGLSGEKLLATLKKNKKYSSIPVILESSSIRVDKIAQKYQAEGFLTKPLSIERLEKVVEEVLKKKSARN